MIMCSSFRNSPGRYLGNISGKSLLVTPADEYLQFLPLSVFSSLSYLLSVQMQPINQGVVLLNRLFFVCLFIYLPPPRDIAFCFGCCSCWIRQVWLKIFTKETCFKKKKVLLSIASFNSLRQRDSGLDRH